MTFYHSRGQDKSYAMEKSIIKASRVGTKVFGWQVGQEGVLGRGIVGKEVGSNTNTRTNSNT